MSETLLAQTQMLDEWGRVPMLPATEHWCNAWSSIVERSVQKFGKDITDNAIARHIKLNDLASVFGGRRDIAAANEIARLQSRIEELERALKPFADASEYTRKDCRPFPDGHFVGFGLTVGDLRQARSVLEASNKGGE